MGPSLRELGLKIITIANQKGGVGKTVTSMTIASGLAKAGQRVLAVDGDPQGNLTLLLGRRSTTPEAVSADEEQNPPESVSTPGPIPAGKAIRRGWQPSRADMTGLLTALARRQPAAMSDHVEKGVRRGLDLLPSRNRRMRLELGDDEIRSSGPGLARLFSRLAQTYDWIIIDTSPSNGPLERVLVGASQAVIIPLEFQLFSVAGLEAILTEIRECATEADHPIRPHALIFIKAENRVNRIEEYRKVFSSLGLPAYEVCRSEYVPRSIEHRKTLWEAAPSSYAARDYAHIIQMSFLR